VSGIVPTLMLEKNSGAPLHKQIYNGFRAAILRGESLPGQQVPFSRALTVELCVSRFPILEAYTQFHAEGYFEAHAGAGTCELPNSSKTGLRYHRRRCVPASGFHPAALQTPRDLVRFCLACRPPSASEIRFSRAFSRTPVGRSYPRKEPSTIALQFENRKGGRSRDRTTVDHAPDHTGR
jgi:DNA-binding transcriptional MocR family regulator